MRFVVEVNVIQHIVLDRVSGGTDAVGGWRANWTGGEAFVKVSVIGRFDSLIVGIDEWPAIDWKIRFDPRSRW